MRLKDKIVHFLVGYTQEDLKNAPSDFLKRYIKKIESGRSFGKWAVANLGEETVVKNAKKAIAEDIGKIISESEQGAIFFTVENVPIGGIIVKGETYVVQLEDKT